MSNRGRLALSVSALIICAWAAAQQKSFTLEQVLGAPFPSSLAAAPSGGKIAWVQNARGVRNIFVAEPPDYKARVLTSYREDDGQEIGDLQWTQDTSSIVFVRGGPPNSQGEIPNPRSEPAGAERAIWMLPAAGGDPKRLAEGASPALSPQGKRFVFLRRGQIWTSTLDGSEKPAQLFQARGQADSLQWSPDGSKLAFVSSRRDHNFIGVYDLGAKTLGWLEPTVDRDSNPVWSPDGRYIAFLRMVSQPFAFGPRREGQPWSIHVAEVATGRGRTVWKAEPGRGSVFRGVEVESQLLWGAGDRLLFPWERQGWTHLYSVHAEGGSARLLTPGEFEVEHVTLTPDGKEVVFSSNQDDIDRRHIWRVPVSGGSPGAVTSGNGLEWAPAVTSDGKAVAFFRSDAHMPARAAIRVGSGPPRDLAPETIPSDFPSAALVEPQAVIFPASDGLPIHGQLFVPATSGAGERRPGVLFFHGGSRRQMLLGWHYRDYYHNAYALNQYLASRGYVVLSVNYRSGTGYGMEFREAINYGRTGASEFNDVLGGGLYLQNRPDVDPKRIGLWGGSYGGYLTALGLARASDLFAAGVDLHGVHDWAGRFSDFSPAANPGFDAEAQRVAFQSSPMASIKTWRSPVLLVHGDDDRNVAFSQTVQLAAALRQQGVEFEQVIFPDEVHGFLTYSRWLEVYRAAADFFDRKLAGKK